MAQITVADTTTRRVGRARAARKLVVIAAVAALGLVACGPMESSTTVATKPGQFRLDEWSITADQPVMKAGRRTITATNLGHHTHEIVIVKAADAASLPTKADGSVNEDRLARVKIGEIGDIAAGATRHKTFALTPGRYVAFCNLVGGMGMGSGMMDGMEHVHFAAGMHTEFTVEA